MISCFHSVSEKAVPIMGQSWGLHYCERLKLGNTLLTWYCDGCLFEVQPQGISLFYRVSCFLTSAFLNESHTTQASEGRVSLQVLCSSVRDVLLSRKCRVLKSDLQL